MAGETIGEVTRWGNSQGKPVEAASKGPVIRGKALDVQGVDG